VATGGSADDSPGWLESASTTSSESSAGSQAEDVPDWLRDLGDEQPSSPSQPPANDIPGWLESASSTPSGSSAGSQAEAVPDWLRDLGEPEAPVTAGESQSHERDWLNADMSDTSFNAPAEQSSVDDVPDWLRADVERTASSHADDEATAAEPSWLRDLDAETGAGSEHAGWQQAPHDAEHAASTGDAGDTSTDWLHDLDTDADVPASESSGTPFAWLSPAEQSNAEQPRDLTSQSDVPAWLQPEESAAEAPASAPDHAPADFTEADSGVPNWLNQTPLDEVREVMSSNQDINPDIAPFSFEGPPDANRANPPSDAPAWLQAPADEAEEGATSSWLDALAPPHAPAPEPENRSADVPSWLQDVDTTQGAAPEPFESLASGSTAPLDMPNWLHEAQHPDEGAEAGETPAWLQAEQREEASASETPPWPPAEPQQTPPDTDIPAWLQTAEHEAPASDVAAWLQTAEHEAPPAHDTPAWVQSDEQDSAPNDVPDWLQASAAHAEQTPQEAAQTPADVPSWLQDADVVPTDRAEQVPDWLMGQAEPPAAPSEAAATSDDTPAWLRAEPAEDTQQRDDLPPWLQDESGAPLPASGASGEPHLPAWLRDAPMDAPPPAQPAEAAPVSDASTWFDDIETAPIEEPVAEEPESEFLGGTQLPSWLSPSETQREQPSDVTRREARELDWLQRIGGIEEEAPSVMPEEGGPRLAPPTAPVRSQAHLQAVALLEQLAARPVAEPATLPETAPAARRRRAGTERLLYVVLLLVLLAGLLVPALSASLNVPPVVSSAQPLFNVFNNLNENDVVLVGYEWNARRISELRPLEQAVIGQLLAKKVKLVIVSTDPQGTLVAFNLRSALAQAGYESRGLDYLWLGYKPGGEVALRSLAQDIPGALRSDFYGDDANISPLAQGFRTNKPLTSLDAFSAVLVLADEPLDVQGWMEQIHRVVPQKPIAFLLPAETAPITQPYMRQKNVYYLAGKSGALAYEELRGTTASDGSIQVQYGQQRLGLLIFAALLLISIVIGAASAATRRRRNAS
jgi:hypothetical protein